MLSKRDRRIAERLLVRQREGTRPSSGAQIEMERELQLMLMLNIKAEIQILGNGEKLGNWLDGKLLMEVPAERRLNE